MNNNSHLLEAYTFSKNAPIESILDVLLEKGIVIMRNFLSPEKLTLLTQEYEHFLEIEEHW